MDHILNNLLTFTLLLTTILSKSRFQTKMTLGNSADIETIVEDKIRLMGLQNCAGQPLSQKKINNF